MPPIFPPPACAAIAKYGKGQVTDDLGTAVTMLVEKNIIPNLVPGALLNSNTFRSERLYNEEVGEWANAAAGPAALFYIP